MVLVLMVMSVVLVVFELFTLGLGNASYDGNCVGDDCGVVELVLAKLFTLGVGRERLL